MVLAERYQAMIVVADLGRHAVRHAGVAEGGEQGVEHPRALGRVNCPTGGSSTGRDSLVIEMHGASGGALAAVLAVRKMQGTSTPYSVPLALALVLALALALLKLPFGALSALLGLVLIHGRFIPGLTDLDSPGQILAYAIALGVAQQAVTGLVDRRGHELLAGIPGKRSSGGARGPAEANAPRELSGRGSRSPK